MSQASQKFKSRAARYTLSANDERSLRFSFSEENGRVYTSELVNLSASGAAFLVEEIMAPYVGEMMNIEFQTPDGQRLAWSGKVARVQQYERPRWMREQALPNPMVVVAIHFKDLPEKHANTIKSSLEKRFTQLALERKRAFWASFLHYVTNHMLMACLYVIAAILTLAILWSLAQPTGNYTKDKGAPWGRRIFN